MVVDGLVGIRDADAKYLIVVGPDDGGGPFEQVGVANLAHRLVTSRHQHLFDLLSLVLVPRQKRLQVVRTRQTHY